MIEPGFQRNHNHEPHVRGLHRSTLSPETLPAPTRKLPCQCRPTSAPLPLTTVDHLPWPRGRRIFFELGEKLWCLQGCFEGVITFRTEAEVQGAGFRVQVILLAGRPPKKKRKHADNLLPMHWMAGYSRGCYEGFKNQSRNAVKKYTKRSLRLGILAGHVSCVTLSTWHGDSF